MMCVWGGEMIRRFFIAVSIFGLIASSVEAAQKKKVIGCCWGFNNATVDDFLSHADQFDKTGLDGVLVWLRGRNKVGRSVGMRAIYDQDWTYDAFAPMIPKLRKMTEHDAFKENFLITMRSPRERKEWTDDAIWARLAENMRVAACIARDGGCTGLHMDLEDYSKVGQFYRKPGEMPYDELCKLVRKRGAEVFKGVFDEYPQAKVLSFWFLSWVHTSFYGRDMCSVARELQDLWPAFVNGILDVLPPSATLIDGNEHAYRFSASENDFAVSANRTSRRLIDLIEPENRVKYASQMQIGFGLYLDMYTNPTNSAWYFPPKNGSRLMAFAENLEQAIDVADEYVWLYGEQFQYVKWGEDFRHNKSCRPDRWEDMLPGFNDIIASAKDCDSFGRKRLMELIAKGSLHNLVQNSACKGLNGELPKPFGCWQPGNKKKGKLGKFGSDQTVGDGDSTSLCAEGVPSGCFTLKLENINPGGLYAVKCSAKGDRVSVRVTWTDVKRKWLDTSEFVSLKDGKGEWQHGFKIVRAPYNAKNLHLHLGVALQPSEKCWFDSIEIISLD
jgi:hypothetical protein